MIAQSFGFDTDTTAGRVLRYLDSGYHLRYEGRSRDGEKYRSNSPLRSDSDSQAFTLVIDDGEHGGWQDYPGNESGSLYQLAERLGIEITRKEADGPIPVASTKRGYDSLAEYAEAHGATAQQYLDAGWGEKVNQYDASPNQKRTRPALPFKTQTGTRYRFLDGQKPYFKSDEGYKRCWYGLHRAIEIARRDNLPLVLCNGEPSVVTAQARGIPATCVTGGENKYPPVLLEELKLAWQGEVLIAFDCDDTGRKVASVVAEQVSNSRVIDLGLSDKGDLGDFCLVYPQTALEQLQRIAARLKVQQAASTPEGEGKSVQPPNETEALVRALEGLKLAIRDKDRREQDKTTLVAQAQSEIDRINMHLAKPVRVDFKSLVAKARVEAAEAERLYLEGGEVVINSLRSNIPDLDKLIGGFGPEVYGFIGAPGMGKAQPLDAKVLTPCGWRKMGELHVGDLVIAASGKPTRVTHIFPQGVKDIYRVTFKDGTATECCEDHLWTVQSCYSRKRAQVWQTLPLKELAGAFTSGKYQQVRWYVPMVEPVEFDQQPITLDPYLLGALIGNGGLSTGRPTFTSADEETVERVRAALPTGMTLESVGRYCYSLSARHVSNKRARYVNPVTQWLKELGLWGKTCYDKFVPDNYKYGSIETRLAVLQGLMDTDGSVSNGYDLEYSTSSRRLSEDVAEIARSLGGMVRVKPRLTHFTSNGVKKTSATSYRVRMSLPESIRPFRLSRKLSAYQPPQKYLPRKGIVAIDLVGQKEAQCIVVEDERHLYITDDYIVTHNSFVMASLAREFLTQEPIFICSTEMEPGRWLRRLAASIARVSASKIKHGNYSSKAEWQRVQDAFERLESMDCHFLDHPSPTPSLLRSAVLDGLNEGAGYAAIIVDSASRMSFPGASADIFNRTVGVWNGLQELYRETKLPVLATSQLGRDVAGRPEGKKRPQLEDAYGGAAIEQNCGAIFGLYYHQYYVKREQEKPSPKLPEGVFELGTLKLRDEDDSQMPKVLLQLVAGAGMYGMGDKIIDRFTGEKIQVAAKAETDPTEAVTEVERSYHGAPV